MLRLILYLIVFYLIWKLIEPYVRKLMNANPEVKGDTKQKRVDLNPNDIEDADFKEIDD